MTRQTIIPTLDFTLPKFLAFTGRDADVWDLLFGVVCQKEQPPRKTWIHEHGAGSYIHAPLELTSPSDTGPNLVPIRP